MSATRIVVPVILATNPADGVLEDVAAASWEGPHVVLTRMSTRYRRHISRHRFILAAYLLFTARQIAIFDVDPAFVSTAVHTAAEMLTIIKVFNIDSILPNYHSILPTRVSFSQLAFKEFLTSVLHKQQGRPPTGPFIDNYIVYCGRRAARYLVVSLRFSSIKAVLLVAYAALLGTLVGIGAGLATHDVSTGAQVAGAIFTLVVVIAPSLAALVWHVV
ncbi:uncharacterized protein AB675_3786 [Cyphellophora attinorum]|uniref:Uncharacterized protein n=1 Tax=Cyphellophora attinorum TaxID=1664694 RepID=A0A0N1H3X4_9EURO|nr:uncharacterized protein AB675_3786 [Phialophora attinorum]KPI35233.1 hypothetical protein AB675_3786 [Phialophora attinorum]